MGCCCLSRQSETSSEQQERNKPQGQNGQVHIPNFEGMSWSEDNGGGDNSIQFINIVRVGDKSFKEKRQKIGGWKGG